jgi:DNA-binding transcriptional MerR regulator
MSGKEDPNSQRRAEVPEKTHFRIGEVCRLTSTKAFVLRYWETEFPMLQPLKTPKGHRLYRRQDIETVLEIKRLLYEEGFTIAGARRHLREHPGNGGGTGIRACPPVIDPGHGAPRKTLQELRDELRALLTLLERG